MYDIYMRVHEWYMKLQIRIDFMRRVWRYEVLGEWMMNPIFLLWNFFNIYNVWINEWIQSFVLWSWKKKWMYEWNYLKKIIIIIIYIFFTISWGCIDEWSFIFIFSFNVVWMDAWSHFFDFFRIFLEKTLCNACEINVFYLFPKIIF